MIRHIVAWDYKEGVSDEENTQTINKLSDLFSTIKKKFKDKIKELNLHVSDSSLSSDRAIILNSLFTDKETLKAYIIDPDHIKVTELVNKTLINRVCLDYLEN
jgi:hypothetical protein